MDWYYKKDDTVKVIAISQMFNLSESTLLIRPSVIGNCT